MEIKTRAEALTQKQLSELETQVMNLLTTLRKFKLHNEPVALLLKDMEQELSEVRRQRFDAANSDFPGY
jgi:hypothetical protein